MGDPWDLGEVEEENAAGDLVGGTLVGDTGDLGEEEEKDAACDFVGDTDTGGGLSVLGNEDVDGSALEASAPARARAFVMEPRRRAGRTGSAPTVVALGRVCMGGMSPARLKGVR